MISEHGVSQNTVDRALVELEKEGLIERRGTSGIYSRMGSASEQKQDLVLRSMGLVGILIFDQVDFYPQIAKAAKGYLASRNMLGVIYSPEANFDNIDVFFDLMAQNNCSGLLLAPSRKENMLKYQRMLDSGMHTVMMVGEVEGCSKATCVMCDNRMGGELAARHFLETRHTNVAIIGIDNSENRERIAGFKELFATAGVDFQDSQVYYTGKVHSPTGAITPDAIRQILEQQKPTAIFALNDVMAIQLYWVMLGLGYCIPDDISIMGFNNSEIARVNRIPLTTIAQPLEQIGVRAAQMLCQKFEGNDRIEHIRLPVALVRGKTVATNK